MVAGDPEQIKTIRRIYSMYVNDNFGITKICNVLNEEGIPSPRNKGWSKATIWTILHDETYIGWVVWNRHVCDNLLERDKGWVKYKPSTEWIITKNAHEPIIEESVFKAVQAKTRQAYKSGNNTIKGRGRGYYTPYLLSGLMKCVKCGGNYQGRVANTTIKGKGYSTRYYLCGNYTMKDNCEKWNVSKDIVEQTAIEYIKKRINNPEWLASMQGKVEKVLSAVKKESSKGIDKVEAELKDVQSRISNLVDAIERGQDKDIIGDRLTELKAKRDRLLGMKADINRNIGEGNDTREAVKAVMNRIQDFTTRFDKAEIPMKKSMIADFIHEIRVDATDKKLYYYMKIIPDIQVGAGALVKSEINPHHHFFEEKMILS